MAHYTNEIEHSAHIYNPSKTEHYHAADIVSTVAAPGPPTNSKDLLI